MTGSLTFLVLLLQDGAVLVLVRILPFDSSTSSLEECPHGVGPEVRLHGTGYDEAEGQHDDEKGGERHGGVLRSMLCEGVGVWVWLGDRDIRNPRL